MSAPRKMTLLPLIAAIYFLVAGGPFGLEDIVSKSGYTGAILILLATPIVWAIPTALMVSELSSALPDQGGYYVWVTRGMGHFWGFQEAWLSLAGSVFDVAIYPTLFVAYLGHLLPWMTAGPRGAVIAIALVAAAAAWNLMGAKSVGDSSVLMGMVLLAPFAVLTIYGFLHPAVPTGGAVPLSHIDLLGGILVAVWNYMGWDYASTVANEVAYPHRTYPRAMAGAVALVTITYVVPIAAVAMTGLDANRWSTGGWADVAKAVIPGAGAREAMAVIVTIGGMLGAWGTLNAQTMQYSRLPAVMADDGLLPRIFARRRAATGAPWIAILACAAAWMACLQLSFLKLIVLDVLLTGLSLLLEFAALVALRIREPELPRPYRVPFGLAGAIGVGLLPLALLVLAMFRNQVEPVGPINALELGAILVAAGVPAYWWANRQRARRWDPAGQGSRRREKLD
jgi:amino acid transporter